MLRLFRHADHPPQTPAEWERWVRVTGQALRKQSLTYQRRDGSGETKSIRLVHVRCRGSHPAAAPVQHSAPPTSPRGLLEPDAR